MQSQPTLYLAERQQEILKLVNQHGRVSVAELSQQFGVSEVTIRADLQTLAERNLVVRTHGGAVPASRGLHEISLALRRQRQSTEKERIGVAGAAMVSDGDAILLDSSSTSLAVARYLKQHENLTIVTNGLMVAQEMLDAPGVTVVIAGGTLRRDTVSVVGDDGLDMLKKFNIQKGFFGAHGFSFPEGLTDVSVAEAELKRPLVSMSRQVIAVLDATKWGPVGLVSFANIEEIDVIITDENAPAELLQQAKSAGIEIILV